MGKQITCIKEFKEVLIQEENCLMFLFSQNGYASSYKCFQNQYRESK